MALEEVISTLSGGVDEANHGISGGCLRPLSDSTDEMPKPPDYDADRPPNYHPTKAESRERRLHSNELVPVARWMREAMSFVTRKPNPARGEVFPELPEHLKTGDPVLDLPRIFIFRQRFWITFRDLGHMTLFVRDWSAKEFVTIHPDLVWTVTQERQKAIADDVYQQAFSKAHEQAVARAEDEGKAYLWMETTTQPEKGYFTYEKGQRPWVGEEHRMPQYTPAAPPAMIEVTSRVCVCWRTG